MVRVHGYECMCARARIPSLREIDSVISTRCGGPGGGGGGPLVQHDSGYAENGTTALPEYK